MAQGADLCKTNLNVHAYILVIRSDPDTVVVKLASGCSVPHGRNGRPRGGVRTWWWLPPAKGPKKTWAPGAGRQRRPAQSPPTEREGGEARWVKGRKGLMEEE